MANNKKTKRKNQKNELAGLDQDEYFYFIAGYTSGGAPYGITWEQAYEEGLVKREDNGDVPFI